MPPIISGPFQNPDRSGLPSGVRGAGFGGAASLLIGPDAPLNSLYGFSGGGVDCAKADWMRQQKQIAIGANFMSVNYPRRAEVSRRPSELDRAVALLALA